MMDWLSEKFWNWNRKSTFEKIRSTFGYIALFSLFGLMICLMISGLLYLPGLPFIARLGIVLFGNCAILGIIYGSMSENR